MAKTKFRPAARPRGRAPHRCRGEDQGRHHHPRHRQGEAAGRARSSPSARAAATRAGKLIPIDLKTGDKVLFGKWSGTEVKIDGEELLIMKESDIMGVIA